MLQALASRRDVKVAGFGLCSRSWLKRNLDVPEKTLITEAHRGRTEAHGGFGCDGEVTQSPHVASMETNVITGEIVRAAMKVHSALGPGLLESAYRICRSHELTKRGLQVIQEKPVQIRYDGVILCTAFRADLLVEEVVLVQLKSVEKLRPLHESQLLSYLKLSGIRIGLLINFNVRHLRHGIKRMIR